MPTRGNAFPVRRITTIAIVTAMALGVQWLESLLPAPVPGVPIKFGLANTLTLFMLLRHGRVDALLVSVLRCLLFVLVSGNVSGLLYSLPGSLLSFAAMALLLGAFRSGRVSPIGMSILGAFSFNLGQLLMGAVLTSPAILAYLLPMGLLSIPAGGITGLLVKILAGRLPATL